MSPDLAPLPERPEIDVATVRQLLADQLPAWSHLPVERVLPGGWDNRTFRLGDELLLRLPSAEPYALAVAKEHRWLPALAPHLPVPIPCPRALGRPGAGYPFPWSVYGWLAGEPAAPGPAADPAGLAEDLAAFLVALRGVATVDGPRPGLHSWYRGDTLRTFDELVRGAVSALSDVLDVGAVEDAWHDAVAAPWDGVDVWFHGDLATGNLLLENGRLAAVIDFGTCGVGDPSCDLAIAWTTLTSSARGLLRERLDVDDAEWSRGRGWALWKALQQLSGALEDNDGGAAAEARRVVEVILADESGS